MEFLTQGRNVTVWPLAKIISPEVIKVGNNVIIDDFVFLMGGRSTTIGNYVHIASFASITGGGDFCMGDFSGLSSGVRVFTGHEDYRGGIMTNPCVPEPYRKAHRLFVNIGKHAVIGANAVILAGVSIGEGCAVGAGSLVKNDLPPWTICVGTPARPIKDRPRDVILQYERELNDMEMKPRVSICCMTYNHANLIRKALDGFLMQKASFPFEILIHDDASTDGTTQILREYQARYPGLIRLIIQEKNLFSATGVYPVINLYKAARGKYIAECDGDDYWQDPHKLQKQADFLDANPDYVMCHHDYLIQNKEKTVKPHGDPPKDFTSIELIQYSLQGHGIGLCTRMFRNLYSEATAGDVEIMAGDYATNVYLGTFGKCKYIPGIEPSVYRRMNGSNSWSSLPAAEKERRHKETCLRIYNWFKSRGNLAHIEMRRVFING